MKNIVLSTLTLILVFSFSGCSQETSTPKVKTVQKAELREDIRILTVENTQGKITTKSIEKAFKANGFNIVGNNDMNKAFEGRFGKEFPSAGKDYNMYRLMFVHNPKITSKLLKDYPEVGLLSPLSTSVYSKDGKSITISSLSLTGMSRISGVPETNTDLIALFDSMTKALKEALPNGKYQKLSYKKIRPDGALVTRFAFVLKNKGDIEEAKESYQETMEGEIESSGFIVAGFYPVNEDLVENGINDYEFYDSYSICKLEVIYPVHKVHPEVGAFAPCTMYMYKKKGEKYTRMGYPSVYNWIMSTNIYDDESITPLIDAQNLLETKIDSTME
ncbi:MAG: DUF302 domain-containing protein [Campylobacterota bacterium]|nr:DUF302 domain-containing protein [Campylobacterota bacterium]